MIVSVGVMFILQAVVRFIIGPNDRKFFDGEKYIVHALDFKNYFGLEEGLTIKSTQLITVIVALVAMISLFYFLQKTKLGKSMRAYSNNEDLALLSGINPEKIVIVTWIISSILITTAGVLYGLDKALNHLHILIYVTNVCSCNCRWNRITNRGSNWRLCYCVL